MVILHANQNGTTAFLISFPPYSTFRAPASEYKVLLYNLLDTFYISGRRSHNQKYWAIILLKPAAAMAYTTYGDDSQTGVISIPMYLTSSTELRSRVGPCWFKSYSSPNTYSE